MHTLNLIPTPRREARRSRALIRRWVMVLVAYVVLMGVGSLVCRGMWGPKQSDISDQLTQSQSDANRLREQIEKLNTQLDHHILLGNIYRDTANHPDWSILLATLSDHLGDKVVLQRCSVAPLAFPEQQQATNLSTTGVPTTPTLPPSVRPHEFVVRLAGFASTSNEVAALLLRIEQTGLFSNVKLIKGDRANYLSAPVISFDIECLLDGQAEAGE